MSFSVINEIEHELYAAIASQKRRENCGWAERVSGGSERVLNIVDICYLLVAVRN